MANLIIDTVNDTRERLTVEINSEVYELRDPSELTLAQQLAAARMGMRFESLAEFRGRMDYGSSEGAFYQRAQYMRYFPHDKE